MASLLYLSSFLTVLALTTGAPSGNKCCTEKTVGGVEYRFVRDGMTGAYSCLADCIYEMVDSPGSMYCFAAGDLKVECEDAPSTYEPSNSTGSGSCKCGQKIYSTERIIGGQETEVNEYPWIVSYAVSNGSQLEHECSGSLIASNWVATAVHCFVDWDDDARPFWANESNLFFVIGAHNWGDDSTDTMRKTLAVDKIIIHPNWNISTFDGDIALVKLSESVDLDVYPPVCLPEKDVDYEGKMAVAIGWGKEDYEDEEYSDILNEVMVKVVSDETCMNDHIAMGKNNSNNSLPILDGMLCAGGEAGIDACTGDSGGPLMVEVDNRYELIGATSFGYGCAQEGLYGVYTEVAKYMDWVEQQFADNGGADMCD